MERSFGRFAELYAENRRPLWAYLRQLGAQPSLADDLSQEAFIRWWNSDAAEWEAARARPYLFSIGTRLLTDWWRKQRREVVWDEMLLDEPAVEGPEIGLFSSAAWRALTKRQRQLLWLAYVAEFNHVEIAAICRLSSGSVRVLLHRARMLLRQLLVAAEAPDNDG